MKKRGKRCLICKDSFNSIHRLGHRQVTCGTPSCRKEHKKQYDRGWHWKNREMHNQSMAEWFGDHPGYMREYMRRYRRGEAPCKISSDIVQVGEEQREKSL